ncbi:MAG: acetyl-CoA carboxylase, carboxyltransferase subunit beta [Coriobacteriia bacterium]|jgi:acetyl-CoA carboxylase carboxyl transferase subunit beta|nr:acetyl-CoA carboxylase, carboxyltransferase subunit beta [Coriobacteriia bacterium]
MSISDWFKAREARRYTSAGSGHSPKGGVADGVWNKCAGCKRIVYEGQLAENMRVCPHCEYHFDLTAHQRVQLIADEGTFEEFDAGVGSTDPLGFVAAKPYTESLASAHERSGLTEGIVFGRATIDGHPVILGAMDFRFIGASMGSAVGEKVARAFELATSERRAVVLFAASGGARMQEGMLSLMQMAKTSAAVRRFAEARLGYISVLTNPTMGGVTASFAVLADVILAEPGALVGFAGPRVIEQTIKQHLPKGFQSAEYLLEHGMIDDVVPRAQLLSRVTLLLDYLAAKDVAS